jgi:AcrR family transcriptional regulator
MTQTNSRRRLVSQEIYDQASLLFLEKGYAGTSLQDIATAMGISRPAVYTYVDNKEEILRVLVHGVLDETVRILDASRQLDGLTPIARLRGALHSLVLYNTTNRVKFRLLDRNETSLPPELAEVHVRERRHILKLVSEMVEGCMRAGEARTQDPRTTALALLGMANWTVWWYRPEIDGDPEPIADLITDMAISGIELRHDSADRTVPWSPGSAIETIRSELASLENALIVHEATVATNPRKKS